MTRLVELGKRRESLARTTVTIRVISAREMNSRRRDIRCVELEVSEVVIDACRPASDIAVAKILCNPAYAQQLHIPRRQSIQIVLETRVVEHSIRGHILGTTGREDGLTLDVVCGGQI